MGIVRKSQKVSAFNFDSKGVKKGAPRDPGPKDPPDPDRVNSYVIFLLLLFMTTNPTLIVRNYISRSVAHICFALVGGFCPPHSSPSQQVQSSQSLT